MTKKPIFSVILPLYKQVDHVKDIVANYKKALDNLDAPYEVLLVTNGPNDGAYQKAVELTKNLPKFRNFMLTEGGWGRAVKFGLSQAKGDHVCYTNSARTNIADLIAILKFAQVNDQMVIKATRIVRESMLRKIGSIFYNLECRFLLRTPVWDINGTPKVIPQKVVKQITLESDDDLIDAELMAKCVKLGIPIVEVPVTITHRMSGKSTTNFSSAFNMYKGVLRVKKFL